MDEPDNSLAKKIRSDQKADLTGSTYSSVKGTLKSPKDVLTLGQMIVHELDHDDCGEVLQRWLAHHLAELMAAADREIGSAKTEAEARAVDLILKLWAHRRGLPDAVDPLCGFRDAVAVLSRLMPEANPWARNRKARPYEHILRNTFQTLSRVVVGGILLTQLTGQREIRELEGEFLEDEEVEARKMLEQWLEAIPPKLDLPQFDISLNTETLGQDEGKADTLSTDLTEHEVSPLVSPVSEADKARTAIIQNLEQAQLDLAELLDQWRARQ